MKLLLSLAGGVLAASVVLAQTPQQPPSQPPSQPPAQTPQQPPAQPPAQPRTQPPATPSAAQGDQQITLLGCITREADYRKAQDQGKGGVAGTGVGAGNEFILTNASMAKQGLAGAPSITDTTFELTGSGEFVGKRVEITGKLKAAAAAPSGAPTGGATAGAPMSRELKLRELEVASVTASTTGTCPAQ